MMPQKGKLHGVFGLCLSERGRFDSQRLAPNLDNALLSIIFFHLFSSFSSLFIFGILSILVWQPMVCGLEVQLLTWPQRCCGTRAMTTFQMFGPSVSWLPNLQSTVEL